MYLKAVLLFLSLLFFAPSFAQELVQDSVQVQVKSFIVRDSAYYAKRSFIQDSVLKNMLVLNKMRNADHPILDSIIEANKRVGLKLTNIREFYKEEKTGPKLRQGKYLPKGQVWSLAFIAGLLILFAVLRASVSRQLQTIVQACFSNRVLANLNKEDGLFSTWPFILLFVVFGFVIGMFYYLVTQFYQQAGGFQYFISISVAIILLYFGKIIILKLLGYVLNVSKAVNEYVTVLFLSYFNVGLLFLPLVVAFVLSPLKYGLYYIAASYIIIALMVGIQFVRVAFNILSAYRFPKLYLFLYFCTLEICPILILIKVIRF